MHEKILNCIIKINKKTYYFKLYQRSSKFHKINKHNTIK